MRRGKNTIKQAVSILIIMLLINIEAVADASSSFKDNNKGVSDSETQWSASVGLGYDSNIYQAPDGTYIDYAPTTQVVVDPATNSGMFLPLVLNLEHNEGMGEKNILTAEYDFYGNFYIDSDYRNADVTSHTVKLGDKYILDKKGRLMDALYAGVIFIKKEDEYTERDTGLDKFSSGGVNISDRYRYSGVGIELKYQKRISKIKYGFKYKVLNRDYKDTVAISELGHKYTLISGEVKFPINKVSKIKLRYKHYIYDYDERPSRTVEGRALLSNPPLEYVYDEYLFSYFYKLNRIFKTYVDYSYTNRSDEYVGYNDYHRNKIKIRMLYDYSEKMGLKVTFTYWDREYPNAFAFDRFVAGDNEDAKSYDGTKLELESNYLLDKRKTFWVDAEWRDENSTDLRYQYDRIKIMTGIKWQSKK